MSANNMDERYHVVEKAIFDAFFLLIEEKNMDKISVSDVIKKAGIVRSTFYNHYENIPDLITSIEDRTIEKIFSLMESFRPGNDEEICKNYFLAVCNYTKENPFLSGLLSSPRGTNFFEKMMKMFHTYVSTTTQNSSHQKTDEFSYLIASTIGCTVGVLHKWSRDKFKAPVEEIATLLTRTFMLGILPYMS